MAGELLVDYTKDTDYELASFPGADIRQISQRQAVVYAPFLSLDQLFDIGYRFIPKCYGPLAVSEDFLDQTGVKRLRNQPYMDLFGSGVLVGIVDDGIDCNSDIFRWENNQSRIISAWDQQSDRYFNNEELTDGTAGEVMRSPSGHGTAMAAVCCGRNGIAPLAQLVVVKLKPARTLLRDYYLTGFSASVYQENDIITAISYIIRQSEILKKPVVIPLGLGTNEGDHNGGGFLGEYISSLSVSAGVYICCATGNEAISSHHVRTSSLQPNEYQDIEINVSKSGAGFTLSMWCSAPGSFSIRIKPPIGDFTEEISAIRSENRRLRFLLNDTVLMVHTEYVERTSGDELMFLRFETPAEGLWTIRVINVDNMACYVDMWLPMEGLSDSKTEFLAADEKITICEPGNAKGVITLGGYNSDNGGLFIKSGRGFTRDGRIKPDLSAPATEIAAYDNKKITGTSMASAIGGGLCALIAEWSIKNYPTNSQSAKNILVKGADTKGLTLPDAGFGYGRVNIYDSFAKIGS